MKNIYIVILLFIPFAGNAQKTVGTAFEQNLSWKQIKEKAKKENKYIFVDGYTTWCAPCRQMAKDIFPSQEVGAFFNSHFINVAVQFDITKNDSKQIKSWYEDAKMIHETYKVDSYPIYLFFNPDGNLVHFIKGASSSPGDFLAKVKPVLKPENQYLGLKVEYKNGKRDAVFLLTLIRTATEVRDVAAADTFINAYLSTQKNLLTAQNLAFIARSTTKSTDIGFGIIKNNPDTVDAIAGKGKSNAIMETIAYDEVVLPYFNRTKTIYPGGMVMYSGDLNKNVNWEELKAKLDVSYVALSEAVIRYAKPMYYYMAEDWPQYCAAVSLYDANHQLTMEELHKHAQNVFVLCGDSASINTAVGWSEKLCASDQANLYYLQSYTRLLYKSGQQDQAIKKMEEYIKLSNPADDYAKNELQKMKNKERTW